MMKAEMPVRAMMTAVDAARRARPMAEAAGPRPAARAGPRPPSSPAKPMATSPPMAPSARFIWPMAMMTICDSAITMLIDDRREQDLDVEGRQERSGWTSAMATAADDDHDERGRTSRCRRSAVRVMRSGHVPAGAGRCGAPVGQHGGEQHERRGTAGSRTRRRACSSRPLVMHGDERGAEQRAEHRDAPAATAACRRAPGRGRRAAASPARDGRPSTGPRRRCGRSASGRRARRARRRACGRR